MIRRVETAGAEETEALGAELAATLSAGDVVLVEGELGAGKTTFVRGACRALGVTDPVTSPTFTIGQRYAGRMPVSHLDLYRLAGSEDPAPARQAADPGALPGEDPALLADYLGSDTIAFVEWPRGGEGALAAHGRIARRVRLTHAGGDRRIVEIE